MHRSRSLPASGVVTTPEGWARVHEVLQDALALEPKPRADFLEAVGRHEAAVRREVHSLLAAVSPGGRFDALVARFVEPAAGETPPALIGAYRPVRLLARGGMGAVYLAERADGAFDKRVALKLLPAGTGADLHSRFLAERRIVARLRHPNIARLLDGGATEDGLPYLVLEYVEGEPITDYCDRRRLPVEARLRLFLEVCAAVSYAHANLVVHRDIKPDNVLVVGDGGRREPPTVKLLDFGIAKLLDDEGMPGAGPATRVGLRPMTPEYAAPEQVLGGPITTATDVYQLGVLLYELISGQRPHARAGRDLRRLERSVSDAEPARPSARVRGQRDGDADERAGARASTAKRLERRLKGDLDTIALQALAREPERRYASVDALAADVRRHLDGLPVKARPDAAVYRAGKFVRRNRVAVVVAGAVALLLAGTAASTVVQNRRIAVERDRAEQAAAFLAELFEGLEPTQARGSSLPTRAILDRGAARVESELGGQPLLQARLYDVLGRVYVLRGYFADAEPLLRRALDLRLAHLGGDDLLVADSRHSLAYLLEEIDRHEAAQPLLEAAADTYRRRLGPDDPTLAQVELDRALAMRATGELEEAGTLLGHVVDVLRRNPDRPQDLATALLYVGKVRLEGGDTAGAEAPIRESLSIRRRLFGRDHPQVANAIDGIGELMQARGEYGAAEAAYREALSIRRELFPSDHLDVGVSLENLGIVLQAAGRSAEAVGLLEDALAVLRPAVGEDHSLVYDATVWLDSARAALPAAIGPGQAIR
jgi:serine/threonine-protein kinase